MTTKVTKAKDPKAVERGKKAWQKNLEKHTAKILTERAQSSSQTAATIPTSSQTTTATIPSSSQTTTATIPSSSQTTTANIPSSSQTTTAATTANIPSTTAVTIPSIYLIAVAIGGIALGAWFLFGKKSESKKQENKSEQQEKQPELKKLPVGFKMKT